MCTDLASFSKDYTGMHGQQNIKFSIFISVINQLDAQQFLFYNKFISCLYMFPAHVLIIRRPKLHYTASGQQNIKKKIAE